MKWNYRIGRLAGIDIFVNITFPLFLLVLFFFIGIGGPEPSLAAAALNIVFICAVFGIIVLHELGHALAARRYGIATRDIILLPIGGVARLERMPATPWQELVVAIAGPAVNVGLALAGALVYFALFLVNGSAIVSSLSGEVVVNFIGLNCALALFNMVPAFPMDGGRVLRAVLALRMNYVRATSVAAAVGQAMALGFFLVAIVFGMPMLIFVAFFVFLGAGQEAQMAKMRAALHGIPVREIMIRRFYALAPGDRIGHATRMLLGAIQDEFPVADERRLVGIVGADTIREAMAAGEEWARVDAFMQHDVKTAAPDDALDELLLKMAEWSQRSVPVVERGALVGLVTRANLQQFIALRSAFLASGRMPKPGSPGWEAPGRTSFGPPQ